MKNNFSKIEYIYFKLLVEHDYNARMTSNLMTQYMHHKFNKIFSSQTLRLMWEKYINENHCFVKVQGEFRIRLPEII